MKRQGSQNSDSILKLGAYLAQFSVSVSLFSIFVTFVTFATCAAPVWASEIYPFFRGVRQEAMGGAAVAVVDDETALYINPAGLGRIRGPYFVVANPEVEQNYDMNAAISNSITSGFSTDVQNLLNLQKKSPDKHFHTRVQVLPTFVTTNFGIGAYSNYTWDSDYFAATDTYHLDYRNDYALALGYCARVWEGRLKIGVTGKLVNRVSISQDLPGSTATASLSTLAAEGTGAGWDAGVMLTAPWTWLPTLAAVAHDIGNTRFNLGSGYFYRTGVEPPVQQQSVDVALAVFPIHNSSTRSSFTVEYHDVQNPETADVYRRVHGGVEVNFSDIFYLRAGMNQRYYTAGLEFDFLHNVIQLATYGEEIGTPTQNKEDRRFTVQYSMRF